MFWFVATVSISTAAGVQNRHSGHSLGSAATSPRDGLWHSLQLKCLGSDGGAPGLGEPVLPRGENKGQSRLNNARVIPPPSCLCHGHSFPQSKSLANPQVKKQGRVEAGEVWSGLLRHQLQLPAYPHPGYCGQKASPGHAELVSWWSVLLCLPYPPTSWRSWSNWSTSLSSIFAFFHLFLWNSHKPELFLD